MDGRIGKRKQRGRNKAFAQRESLTEENAAQCKRSRRGMWDHLRREILSFRKKHFRQEGGKKGS